MSILLTLAAMGGICMLLNILTRWMDYTTYKRELKQQEELE